jgi:hypothetical protein
MEMIRFTTRPFYFPGKEPHLLTGDNRLGGPDSLPGRVGVCMCGFCNVWVCVCVGFVMSGCVYVWVL